MASIPQSAKFDGVADSGQTREQVLAVVRSLASLKITVTVFALSLFLILAGSLAQARTDVWLVVGQYFRCWIAWVDIRDLFPPAFFPSWIDYDWDSLPIRRFPYPGGWTLGLIATINLFAAHGLRFKVQAKGRRLTAGLVMLAVGVVITWIVVASGMNADGFQTESVLSYGSIWRIFQLISLVTLGWAGWKCFGMSTSLWGKGSSIVIPVLLAGVTIVNQPLTDASMRILWQLMKAEFASIVLLGACWLLFKKRSGVVLVHAGVAILMLSEVQVGLTVSENQFQIVEGDTKDYIFDLREREIAVVDTSTAKPRVVVIPEAIIHKAFNAEDNEGRVIRDKRLPFDLEVVEYYQNSTVRQIKPQEETLATAGVGLQAKAEEAKPATGLDSNPDRSTAFVTLRDKDSGRTIGTYMLSMTLSAPESVLVDGKLYDMSLRFKRTYKPYTVTLLDIQKRDYEGTSTPRDYSSYVRLQDPERGVDQEVRIWMNNPLRYRGETIYQTGYDVIPETGEEVAALQVVDNRAWMLPYMACMIAFTGLAVQFGMALFRYQNRRANEAARVETDSVALADQSPFNKRNVIATVVLTAIVAGYIGSKGIVRRVKDGQPDLYTFGEIPCAKGGRQQPFSSVALARLRVLTNGKTEFHRELRESEMDKDWKEIAPEIADAIPGLDVAALDKFRETHEEGQRGVGELVAFIASGADLSEEEVYARLSERTWSSGKKNSAITRKSPAIWWMLDVIARRPEARRHRVFRIDEPSLLKVLDLEPRDGATYSLAEIMVHFDELSDQVEEAERLLREDEDRATRFQRQLYALAINVSRVNQLRDVFTPFERDGGPHNSLVRITPIRQVLDRLAQIQKDTSFVKPIPRSGKDPARRWDTLALGAWKREMLIWASAQKVKDVKGMSAALMAQIPEEHTATVEEVATLVTALKERMANDPTAGDSVNMLAARVLLEVPEGAVRLREMLRGISRATSDDPAEIHKTLPHDRLLQLAYVEKLLTLSEDVSRELRKDIEQLFGSTALPTDERIQELVGRATLESLDKLFTDADVAAGPTEDADRLLAIMKAWGDDDIEEFNRLAEEQVQATAGHENVDGKRTSFEAWFNHAAMSYYCAAMYLVAFALACASLLAWEKPLGRATFLITLVTFGFHTYALVARIYISGRPPVTNLYSSAVFIGWGAVVMALIYEAINKRGVGNLVSTAAGASTLVIAYLLGNGDTFEVLQAVLDTQFWLATHVVSITLGYSATFLAGLFGIVFILKGLLTPSLTGDDRRELSRMIYGTLCFAILFSFIGTILGGLWADDSWGRFWGWDTKENGAMMICIWNAIVLHARWDKMVKDRGMAVLAVGGNIVTAWSWFGVNELGAGLHSYGFTEGALRALLIFALSQLLIICLGLFPKELWSSYRKEAATT